MRGNFVLPFPPQAPQAHRAAPRLASLAGARIAVIDNSRMSYAAYGGMADMLRQAIEERHSSALPFEFQLLTANSDDIRDCAAKVCAAGACAALIGVAESGITQATISFAVELEKAGIPTVTLCADPGVALARATGSANVHGLRIVDMQTRPHCSAAEANEAVGKLLPQIFAALTGADSGDEAAPAMFPAAGELERAWAMAAGDEDAGESSLRFLRACEAQKLGDGLPIIPPTRKLVDAMLQCAGRPAEQLVLRATPPSGWALDVERAAANAVMAGCEPAQFPVVLAALEAMDAPRYRLHQAAITTHASANIILVSGPLAAQAGIANGAGCLGPAQRANLAIGRAVNFCLINILRSIPGLTDLGTFGSIAEIGTCFADRAFGTWPALHEELAGREASSVTVLRCEAPHNVMDHLSRTPEDLLRGVAAAATSISSNNAYAPAELLVVLSPDHAALVQKQGWSRRDVQHYLFETARNPRQALAGRGIHPAWPAFFHHLESVPVVEAPQHIIVVVAGGPGTHSQVAPPWGFSRASTVVVDHRGQVRP